MKTGFYPYPLRGGRRLSTKVFLLSGYISIHALREEGDNGLSEPGKPLMQFLSTPSARRATECRRTCRKSRRYFYPRPPRGGRHHLPSAGHQNELISIHALREEGDHLPSTRASPPTNFYPRPPRGGRRRQALPDSAARYFYPRPPRGGRRLRRQAGPAEPRISIHALREEGDPRFPACTLQRANFYPRPP